MIKYELKDKYLSIMLIQNGSDSTFRKIDQIRIWFPLELGMQKILDRLSMKGIDQTYEWHS